MSGSSAITQRSFRVRNDDGTETTATWKAAENTNVSQVWDVNFRLRFEIEETGSVSLASTYKLQRSINGGTYADVNSTSTGARPAASANFADGAATTNQITTSTRAFVAGTMDEVDGAVASVTLSNQQTELEFSLQLRSADLVAGDTVAFRLVRGASTALNVYTNTPTLTAAAPPTTHTAVAALTGESQMPVNQGAGSVTRPGEATLSSDATWAAEGQKGHIAEASLVGDSSLVAAAETVYSVSQFEVPYGLGVPPATTTHEAAVSLVSDSSLAAVGSPTKTGVVAMNSDATMAADGTKGLLAASVMNSDATMAAAGGVTSPAAVVMTGESEMTPSAVGTIFGDALMSSDGTFAAAGVLNLGALAAMNSDGTFAAVGTKGLIAAAVLDSDSALTALASLGNVGASALSSDATFAAGGDTSKTGDAVLASDATMAAAAVLSAIGASAMNSDGTWAAAGALIHPGAVALNSDSTLAALAAYIQTGAALLSSDGTFTAVGTRGALGAAVLSSGGTFVGAGVLHIGGAVVFVGESSLGGLGSVGVDVGTVLIIPAAPFRVIVADLQGNWLEEVPFQGLRVSWVLNDEGPISFSMPLTHPKATADLLDPGKRELLVLRQGVKVWGGRLWQCSPDVQNDKLQVIGSSYFSLLKRRHIMTTLKRTDADQLNIAWAIIENLQTLVLNGVSGDMGITRFDPAETSGIDRTMKYWEWERVNAADALLDLAEANNGFDFDITSNKKWKTWFPHRGNKSDFGFELGKNIHSLSYDKDATEVVSEMTGLGGGSNRSRCIAVVVDPAALAAFGILQASEDHSNVKHYDTLQDKTEESLRMRRRARVQPSLTVSTTDPDFDEVDIGDEMMIRANYGYIDLNQRFRLMAKTDMVSDEGEELFELEFDEETLIP